MYIYIYIYILSSEPTCLGLIKSGLKSIAGLLICTELDSTRVHHRQCRVGIVEAQRGHPYVVACVIGIDVIDAVEKIAGHSSVRARCAEEVAPLLGVKLF